MGFFFELKEPQNTKMKLLKVLLLSAGFASADNFQIRTKIEVENKSSLRVQNDEWYKNGIKADLETLFCTEMKFDGTKKCEIKVLDDFDNVEEDGEKLTGEVQFAVSLEMEEGKSVSKSDVKKHFKDEVEAITTTEEPSTTPKPTPEPTDEPSGDGSGDDSGEIGEVKKILESGIPDIVFADRKCFIH